MNERSITVDVLKHLRGHLPGSKVLKHMDTGTRGIPDISVGWRDRISYVELKYLREGRKLKEICDAPQLVMCHELGEVHGDRSWVIVYEEEGSFVTIWKPRALFAKLWPRVSGPGEWNKIGTAPLVCSPGELTRGEPLNALDVYGALRVTEWSYAVATILIAKAVTASVAEQSLSGFKVPGPGKGTVR